MKISPPCENGGLNKKTGAETLEASNKEVREKVKMERYRREMKCSMRLPSMSIGKIRKLQR